MRYVVLYPYRKSYRVFDETLEDIAQAILILRTAQQYRRSRPAIYRDDAEVCRANKYVTVGDFAKLTKVNEDDYDELLLCLILRQIKRGLAC